MAILWQNNSQIIVFFDNFTTNVFTTNVFTTNVFIANAQMCLLKYSKNRVRNTDIKQK